MDPYSTPHRTECNARLPAGTFSKSQESSESEGETALNELQRKMRQEHRQALAKINRACIVTERIRRKRITVSCAKLRELLPKVHGMRSDMVTVLEMTIAFLEHIHEFAKGPQYREILHPPEHLYCRWLLETHLKKQQYQRRSCEEERQQASQPRRTRASKAKHVSYSPGRNHRHAGSEAPAESEGVLKGTDPSQQHIEPGCETLKMNDQLGQTVEKITAPSFWSPAGALMSPTSQTLETINWDQYSAPEEACHEEACSTAAHATPLDTAVTFGASD